MYNSKPFGYGFFIMFLETSYLCDRQRLGPHVDGKSWWLRSLGVGPVPNPEIGVVMDETGPGWIGHPPQSPIAIPGPAGDRAAALLVTLLPTDGGSNTSTAPNPKVALRATEDGALAVGATQGIEHQVWILMTGEAEGRKKQKKGWRQHHTEGGSRVRAHLIVAAIKRDRPVQALTDTDKGENGKENLRGIEAESDGGEVKKESKGRDRRRQGDDAQVQSHLVAQGQDPAAQLKRKWKRKNRKKWWRPLKLPKKNEPEG